MGVPKFYRWLSERYPCLSEVVQPHSIPAFDNLYLDMNGLIHPCSHPNSDDPHFRIDEEQIFKNIFNYIEFLFRMIRPRQLLFLAVDGVAPRAKMNQQRARRFRTAKDAESSAKRAKERGEELPKQPAFDSNAITPGTPFMARLHRQLQYFISSKVSSDPLWQGVRVVLSGHDVPGEGEHKVMNYIRYAKAKPDYDPNIRHCLYGLDADLIMLGLCTHDPHFSLLREEVKFGNKDKRDKKGSSTVNPDATTFHLLHLSLLREYIDLEFGSELKSRISFDYDLESIIDDWILMGFLVGNDFIPHLPHLHINKGALTELYDAYKQTMPKLDGYITCNGMLNLSRFSVFLRCLSENELGRFDDIYSDAKWIEGKKAIVGSSNKGFSQHRIEDTPGPAHVVSLLGNIAEEHGQDDNMCVQSGSNNSRSGRNRRGNDDSALARLLNSADEFIDDDEDCSATNEEGYGSEVDDENQGSNGCRGVSYEMEFRQFKRQYYISNMGYGTVDDSVLRDQAETFVRALQWNLHYYYHGCASWSWFYPHHYAPFITDIAQYSDRVNLRFDLGRPFLPFEQLLAVLPAASRNLLPLPLQALMTNQTSPIIDFYPLEFKTDLNGKQQDWEAVVLIPFIDEHRLVEAMKPWLENLTGEEKIRNNHGYVHIFSYTSDNLGRYESPGHFPPLALNHAKEEKVNRDAWHVPRTSLQHGLMKGVRLDVYFPGFPTLKHLKHTSSLREGKVKVFQQESRGFNLILSLESYVGNNLKLEDLASQLHDREVWINWPHLKEAKVVSVCDSRRYIDQDGQEGKMGPGDFRSTVETITDRYKTRWGVLIGKTNYLVYVQRMTGRKYVYTSGSEVTLSKQWSRTPEPVAFQTLVKDITIEDASFSKFLTLEQVFKKNSTCFVLTNKNQLYGCRAIVKGVDDAKGQVVVDVQQQLEPNLSEVEEAERINSPQYYSAGKAARAVGLNANSLSRITGSVLVTKSAIDADPEQRSKINIGLNIKFSKRNEEIFGFTRRIPGSQQWLYSSRTIELLLCYGSKFPEVFDFLNNSSHSDVYSVGDVFKTCHDPLKRLSELSAWLKQLPSAQLPKSPCGLKALEDDIVRHLEKVVDLHYKRLSKEEKAISDHIRLKFNPDQLFKPQLELQNVVVDERCRHFNLFDRVVNVREGYAAPLGLRGTVVSVSCANNSDEMTQVEVLFDQSFTGGLSLKGSSNNRAAKVPATALVNITFGSFVKGQRKKIALNRTNYKNANDYGDDTSIDGYNSYGTNSKASADAHRSISYSKALLPETTNRYAKKSSDGDKRPPDPKILPPPPLALLSRNKEPKESKKVESEEQKISRELKAMLKIEDQDAPTTTLTTSSMTHDASTSSNPPQVGFTRMHHSNRMKMALPFGPPTFPQRLPVRPQSQGNYVRQLHSLTAANRWAPAHFSFRQEGFSPQGLPFVYARLVVNGNRNFYSSNPCFSEEQAGEDVARVALEQLTQGQHGERGFGQIQHQQQLATPPRPNIPPFQGNFRHPMNRPRGMVVPFGEGSMPTSLQVRPRVSPSKTTRSAAEQPYVEKSPKQEGNTKNNRAKSFNTFDDTTTLSSASETLNVAYPMTAENGKRNRSKKKRLNNRRDDDNLGVLDISNAEDTTKSASSHRDSEKATNRDDEKQGRHASAKTKKPKRLAANFAVVKKEEKEG